MYYKADQPRFICRWTGAKTTYHNGWYHPLWFIISIWLWRIWIGIYSKLQVEARQRTLASEMEKIHVRKENTSQIAKSSFRIRSLDANLFLMGEGSYACNLCLCGLLFLSTLLYFCLGITACCAIAIIFMLHSTWCAVIFGCHTSTAQAPYTRNIK